MSNSLILLYWSARAARANHHRPSGLLGGHSFLAVPEAGKPRARALCALWLAAGGLCLWPTLAFPRSAPVSLLTGLGETSLIGLHSALSPAVTWRGVERQRVCAEHHWHLETVLSFVRSFH